MKLLSVFVLLFAILRFLIQQPPIDLTLATVYKDIAHIFVGGIFGAAIAMSVVCWMLKHIVIGLYKFADTSDCPGVKYDLEHTAEVIANILAERLYGPATALWYLATGLTIVEIVAFLTSRI